jgi:acyl carrier protein
MSASHAQVVALVREIILTSWPHRFSPEQLANNVSLGSDGLGLDSVEVAELLIACEERFDIAATSELFDMIPLTVDRVAGHFAAA